MAFVNVFCFWFSVRLGSITIGCFTLIQASVWLTFCVLWMKDPVEHSRLFNEFLDTLSIKDGIVRTIANGEPNIYLATAAAFFTCLAFSCILLAVGSFQCKPRQLYPFAFLYLVYVLFLVLGHVFLMISFKNQEYGIGSLILYSNLGSFVLLYLLYLWVCVVSFIQIIHELRAELGDKKLIPGIQVNKKSNVVSARLGIPYRY